MKLLITVVVVAVLGVVPATSAAELDRAGGPGAGGPVLIPNELAGHSFAGGPGAGGPALAGDMLDYEPVGGPGAGGPVLSSAPTAAADGHDWPATGIGTAVVLGLVLITAVLVMRRRASAAQPQH